MSLVKQLGPKRVSIIGISAAGGFLHNVGQLITASWIAQSWSVMLYLPVLLLLSSIIKENSQKPNQRTFLAVSAIAIYGRLSRPLPPLLKRPVPLAGLRQN